MTNLVLAYVIIVAGFLMLAAEVFLPTGGILTGTAVIAEIVGVSMVFYFADLFTSGITLAAVLLTMPVFGVFVFRIFPKTAMGRRLVLRQPSGEDDTITALPELSEMEKLRGRIGKAVSPLRPSGVVEFDGRRIDSISEGIFVDVDTWVRCIDVRAGKVLVRPIDEPKLSDLETADFS